MLLWISLEERGHCCVFAVVCDAVHCALAVWISWSFYSGFCAFLLAGMCISRLCTQTKWQCVLISILRDKALQLVLSFASYHFAHWGLYAVGYLLWWQVLLQAALLDEPRFHSTAGKTWHKPHTSIFGQQYYVKPFSGVRAAHLGFKGPKNRVHFTDWLLKDLNVFSPVYMVCFYCGCCLFLSALWVYGTLQ